MNGRFALVVDRRGAALEEGSHDTVVVRHADGRRERVGMAALGHVVLHGDVQLGTGLVQSLAAHGVALTLLPLRSRAPGVAFTTAPYGHAALRHLQHCAYADPRRRIMLARYVVIAKCRAMAGFARSHALEPQADAEALRAMQAAAQADSVATLMGIEGACTERHFRRLGQAYGSGGPFRFDGRNRLPPLDAPNALMSLAYTLAMAQAERTLLRCGLDVQLGFLHGLLRNRHSLACDLVEPARAAIDAWVLDILARRCLLTAAHFSGGDGDPVLLTREGRALFYPAWFAEGALRAQAPMRTLLAGILRELRWPDQNITPEEPEHHAIA